MASRQILIIDDEPSIIDNMVYALSQKGMNAASANTGTAGLKLLTEQPFDLVILDIGLPDVSGIDVCKEIRQESNIRLFFSPDAVMKSIASSGWNSVQMITSPNRSAQGK